MDRKAILESLGIRDENLGLHDGCEWIDLDRVDTVASSSPGDGSHIASATVVGLDAYESIVSKSEESFKAWRKMPAPQRGEIVRQLGNALRAKKTELGALVALEMGKIFTEGEGEVQEMIDICDFAVGLSRQLYGFTMPSERPDHRMCEQYHPLGTVGIITAFNFPVAVWAWNAALAAVCGDVMIWKPSLKTPLTAVAVQNIVSEVAKEHGIPGVFNMIIGRDAEVGDAMTADRRLPLISATGSSRMGKIVGARVAGRLGRSLLELGGNNAMIVMDDADIDMAVRSIVFGSVGTAGQRCTSTRRVLMQKGVAPKITEALVKAYASVRIGDPLDRATLMGPLIDDDAIDQMMKAIDTARSEGGEILCGGERIERAGSYVTPCIIKADSSMTVWREETFAPILYLFEVEDLDEAMELHNCVDQGLSSAIFTLNLRQAEKFLSYAGSDCGIANVNIGTSGAEIGGAFGGEKDTGGGRESGSDAWKVYMRRQTNTINWSDELPLAQGVSFDI
jgi:L-aminoadipate-semialdehyde dehydrogenase